MTEKPIFVTHRETGEKIPVPPEKLEILPPAPEQEEGGTKTKKTKRSVYDKGRGKIHDTGNKRIGRKPPADGWEDKNDREPPEQHLRERD